jgi:rubrerythrin
MLKKTRVEDVLQSTSKHPKARAILDDLKKGNENLNRPSSISEINNTTFQSEEEAQNIYFQQNTAFKNIYTNF